MNGHRNNEQRKRACRLVAGLCLLTLSACQTPPLPPSGTLPTSADSPREVANAVRYEIRPDLSDLRFLVFRAGPLARLGHNHVIRAKNIRGEIRLATDIHQSSFFITIPVKDLAVDEINARADEGEAFSVQPDAEAIAGTKANMLGEKVLDAVSYPTLEIESIALNGPAWGLDARVRILLHGVAREIVVPTAIDASGERLTVTASLAVNQTDFGIVPMSVLGGGLRVEDTVRIRVRVVAEKTD